MSARTRKALSPVRRVKRTPVSSGSLLSNPLLWVAALGIGGFALFKSQSASAQGSPLSTPLLPGNAPAQPVQAGTQNIPELPGSMAVTSPQVSSAASYWATLAPVQGFDSGYINFPSGSQAAAALFPVRADVYGSPYVQWAGVLFILTGPDSSGNYTATQIQTG